MDISSRHHRSGLPRRLWASKDYPYGALDRQRPIFKSRGLDLTRYFNGTLNIDIRSHTETKLRNFQNPSLLEMIAYEILEIKYGDEVRVLVNPEEIEVSQTT